MRMAENTTSAAERLSVRGIELEVLRRGAGHPVLLLHGLRTVRPRARFLDLLSRHAEIIAPSHPGFGHSPLPDDFDTVYDLVHLYLDVLEHQPYPTMTLLGLSFGGWLAAEIAVTCSHRVDKLILVDAVGIKVGDRETRDIVDIFAITQDKIDELAFFNPQAGKRDYKSLPDADVLAAARNREATGRFAWSPYMHDPKLKGRLHRIRIPALVLWGAADRIASEHYGRAYCAALPRGQFELIERAGHYPHLEQPEEFARRVYAFTNAK